MSSDGDPDDFAGVRSSPEVDLAPLLQNHVIAN
jgi:hypothetical protein